MGHAALLLKGYSMSDRNVIMLEFNELTPELVDRFIAEGHLPNFARLRSESVVAITDAGETAPNLEPWIQWVTIHTGLTFAEHKVFDLGDGPRLRTRRIWDIASDLGKKIWICGSMNAAVQAEQVNGLVLPDPWATEVTPMPTGLFEPYLKVVRTYVQEHTKGKPKISKIDILRFCRFMIANGLSLKTVTDTLRQLAIERLKPFHWRRATILDRLQWDLFRCFYRRDRPALATFFLNSTAHYQHYFWRNMDPTPFSALPTPEAQAKYADAILFGYRKMDELVGECLDLAGPLTSIVLCTALSQQPMLGYENIGGKLIFKPHDEAKLFRFAGVTGKYKFASVMAEQFQLFFETEADAAAAEEKIAALKLTDGARLMMVRRHGTRLFSGCQLVTAPSATARISRAASEETVAFDEMFYAVESVRSGMHHPDGMLWIRLPERHHVQVMRRVPLVELAPTLLSLADVNAMDAFPSNPMPEICPVPVAHSADPTRAAA